MKAREQPMTKRIEIYTSGGSCWVVNMGLMPFERIMADDVIMDDAFIPVEMLDGTKGHIRKRAIEGFCEQPQGE